MKPALVGLAERLRLSLGAVALAGFCACVPAAESLAAEAQPFGVTSFTVQTTQAGKVPYGPGIAGYGFVNEPYAFTQAGGHPDGLTSTLQFTTEEMGASHAIAPTRDLEDMVIELPPGLSADTQAQPHCRNTHTPVREACPTDTQVGVFVLRLGDGQAFLGPIVNLTPEAGQPAELALEVQTGEEVIMFPLVGYLARMASGYALAVAGGGFSNPGLVGSEALSVGLVSVETTLWGVPAESGHDPLRGLFCTTANTDQQWSCEGGGIPSGATPAPFLTMPSDCSAGPQTAIAWVDSWEESGRYVQARSTLPGVTGCELLPFAPEVSVKPDTQLADSPVGLAVSLDVLQTETTQEPATPSLRDATVTLPAGLSISPAGAEGRRACQPTGPEGIDMPTGVNANAEPLQPDEAHEGQELGGDGLARLAPGRCPGSSTVGIAQATTPLVATPLQGRVYLAAPACGGPGQASCTEADALDGNLYRLYIELGGVGEAVQEGVIVKLEAGLEANPATGQLTVKIVKSPQLTLSQLKIDFDGGPRALLDNPAVCTPVKMTADLSPWSAPGVTPEGSTAPGTGDAESSSLYEAHGCASSPGLAPELLSGTVSSDSGGFSPFTLSVSRQDREQYLSAIQVHTPPGLLGMLASVPLCEEALANAGTCPPASRIGATAVAAGAGSAPLEMPGSVYLTGPYKGAPFGLSIVTPAIAGPFNLGLVVIRARIDIDPQTAALTITSDPLPQIVLGIPLRLRRIALDLDRSNFIFNPTNCDAQQIMATVTGEAGAGTNASGRPTTTQGATATVSSPFAVGACTALAFKPALSASAAGRPGAGAGASLDMKLTFPHAGPGGEEAHLARVKLALPKQLATRLTSLQQACEDAVFAANPAACPHASIVGGARARTPVLAGELSGPIYLVSHGAAAFPSLVVVLQGDGVRFDLTGSTAIDARSVTSVAFRQVPDVPVRSFEAYLPQGPHSALGAASSLCALSRTVTVKRTVLTRTHGPHGLPGRTVRRTIMLHQRIPHSALIPTVLVAQNGLVSHRGTVLSVTGCGGSRRPRR